jgi:hypothetical protein
MMKKKPLASLLAMAVAAEALHAPLGVMPHTELDVKEPIPQPPQQLSASVGSVSAEALGRFRWNTFYLKRARAHKSKDPLAMLNAYLETARQIAICYPDLKLWERQHQYNCFKSEIELTKMRTRGCRDYSEALLGIAQVLGVPAAALSSLQERYKNPKNVRIS